MKCETDTRTFPRPIADVLSARRRALGRRSLQPLFRQRLDEFFLFSFEFLGNGDQDLNVLVAPAPTSHGRKPVAFQPEPRVRSRTRGHFEFDRFAGKRRYGYGSPSVARLYGIS